MTATVDVIVVIGRFQPFHRSHLLLIQFALQTGKRVVLVLGSSAKARSPRNPFTVAEREAFVRACFSDEENDRITVTSARDHFQADEAWIAEIQGKVNPFVLEGEKVGLLGKFKDSSSYYLNMFPQWERITPPADIPLLDATTVRTHLFNHHYAWRDLVPEPMVPMLQAYQETDDFWNLKYAHEDNTNYPSWLIDRVKEGKIGVQVNAADAVVTKSGHVLLVRRGGRYGKGLLALPGGFKDAKETFEATALRELREETRIDVPFEVLKRSIKDKDLFDHPERSERCTTVSMAYHVDLGYGPLPKIKAGDDAAGALWMPLSDLALHENQFFEDHYSIIKRFVRV